MATLIVAHQTAESRELVRHVRAIVRENPEQEFTLLVPATPAAELRTGEQGQGTTIAGMRAGSSAALLRATGARVTRVVVGSADPIEAVGQERAAGERVYTGILLATFPSGVSRWLRMDLPHRLADLTGLPVAHIVSPSVAEAPVAAGAEHPLSGGKALDEFLHDAQWR